MQPLPPLLHLATNDGNAFHNVLLDNLQSFFQLDHHVDSNLYLIEADALYQPRKSEFLTSS